MQITFGDRGNFVKNPETGVVVNNDIHEYESYVAERKRLLDLKSMNEEISTIKTDMTSIKQLLEKLITQGTSKV